MITLSRLKTTHQATVHDRWAVVVASVTRKNCQMSIKICPCIQGQRLDCQLRPMSSLFLLDVYGPILYLLNETSQNSNTLPLRMEWAGSKKWLNPNVLPLVTFRVVVE